MTLSAFRITLLDTARICSAFTGAILVAPCTALETGIIGSKSGYRTRIGKGGNDNQQDQGKKS